MTWRLILIPFNLLYGLAIAIRNMLFSIGINKTREFDTPIICVGNLSTGGTGKSPMTEYLVRLLKDDYKTATLSRGYGRSTNGIMQASKQMTAKEIGDEPAQYIRKFADVDVWVGEDRVAAVNKIIESNRSLIVLDDAYQHRRIKAGFNVLLSTYENPFYKDLLLPAGNLREFKSGASRANAVVISKCPIETSSEDKNSISSKVKRYTDAPIFFASTRYGNLKALNANKTFGGDLSDYSIVLLTGIADPRALRDHLSSKCRSVQSIAHPDHHTFSEADINSVKKIFDNIDASEKLIVTTEKDVMRLLHGGISELTKDLPIYYQEIEVEMHEADAFNDLIKSYVRENSRNS